MESTKWLWRIGERWPEVIQVSATPTGWVEAETSLLEPREGVGPAATGISAASTGSVETETWVLASLSWLKMYGQNHGSWHAKMAGWFIVGHSLACETTRLMAGSSICFSDQPSVMSAGKARRGMRVRFGWEFQRWQDCHRSHTHQQFRIRARGGEWLGVSIPRTRTLLSLSTLSPLALWTRNWWPWELWQPPPCWTFQPYLTPIISHPCLIIPLHTRSTRP